VIPISGFLRQVLEAHRGGKVLSSPDELVFRTRTGTPLSSKNLYNRVLAPACDRIKQPRISWHSFRHTCDVACGSGRVYPDRTVAFGSFGSWYQAQYLGTRNPRLATSRRRTSRGSFVLRCSQIGGRRRNRANQPIATSRLSDWLVGPLGFEPRTNGL
jgi:integrase